MATMTTPRPGGRPPRGPEHETTFTRNLRYEWASEEGRALVGSYAISFAIDLFISGAQFFHSFVQVFSSFVKINIVTISKPKGGETNPAQHILGVVWM